MSKYNIDFEKPPVTEVVFSMNFKELANFGVPHVGILWQKFQSDYPFCKELAPLAVRIEKYDGVPSAPEFAFSEMPPLPRVWFFNEDESAIVQLQRDRLVYNWKKTPGSDKYPRFEEVFSSFQDSITRVKTFLDENGIGSIEPVQYELTYINHVPQTDGWTNLNDLHQFFPMFNTAGVQNGFLPDIEALSFSTQYQLPNKSGRMFASVQSATRNLDKLPVIQFTLTVRGIGTSELNALKPWFETAREWIVKGFVELTGNDVQYKAWKRQ